MRFKFGLKVNRQFKTKFNYFLEGRIISVPTLPPLIAFSIIFGSAFKILVLILERSIILEQQYPSNHNLQQQNPHGLKYFLNF